MTAGPEYALVVFGGYGQGISGAERMAWRTVDRLTRRDHSVVALTDGTGPAGLVAPAWRVVGSAAELADGLPDWRPSVVHGFDVAMPAPLELARGLADRFGVPLALTPCTALDVCPEPERGRAACRAADVVFTLTAVEEAQLRAAGVPASRMRRVPSASDLVGVPDPSRFRRRHGVTGPIVLFLGRHVAFKGYRALLGATREVWRHRPDTAFVFVGPAGDPDTGELFDAHADPRLHALGVLDEQDKHDALAAAALVCLPSSFDVFPLVFIEAWSCGLPVISGDFEGAGDVVRHGVDGLIVPPRPPELVTAVTELLDDGNRRAAMGRAGRQRVRDEFSWDRVATEYEAGYRWARGRRRRGSG